MPAVQSPLCGPYWKTMEKKNEMLKTIPPIPLRYIEVKDSLNPTAPPELKQTISPAVSWERINNIETPQLYPVFPGAFME